MSDHLPEVIEGQVVEEAVVLPALRVDATVELMRKVQEAKEAILVEGRFGDFWVIPDTGGKPTLLKPGAEKLCHLFGFRLARMARTERFSEPDGFAYTATLEDREGRVVGECEGFCFRNEKGKGSSPLNTLAKMAQKRAFVGAVLIATGASALFTQDVEDFTVEDEETGEVVRPMLPNGRKRAIFAGAAERGCDREVVRRLARALFGHGISKMYADEAPRLQRAIERYVADPVKGEKWLVEAEASTDDSGSGGTPAGGDDGDSPGEAPVSSGNADPPHGDERDAWDKVREKAVQGRRDPDRRVA